MTVKVSILYLLKYNRSDLSLKDYERQLNQQFQSFCLRVIPILCASMVIEFTIVDCIFEATALLSTESFRMIFFDESMLAVDHEEWPVLVNFIKLTGPILPFVIVKTFVPSSIESFALLNAEEEEEERDDETIASEVKPFIPEDFKTLSEILPWIHLHEILPKGFTFAELGSTITKLLFKLNW